VSLIGSGERVLAGAGLPSAVLFCQAPCRAQLSGWDPSMSVNPYSLASWAEVTECWFHRARLGSAASAATARPTYRGDSEEANPAGAVGYPPVRSVPGRRASFVR
jgi:hypothetical protein